MWAALARASAGVDALRQRPDAGDVAEPDVHMQVRGTGAHRPRGCLTSARARTRVGAPQRWPEVDEEALKLQNLPLVLSVNGRKRGQLEVPADVEDDTDAIMQHVLQSPVGQAQLAGKPVRQVFAKMRGAHLLVNVVVDQ